MTGFPSAPWAAKAPIAPCSSALVRNSTRTDISPLCSDANNASAARCHSAEGSLWPPLNRLNNCSRASGRARNAATACSASASACATTGGASVVKLSRAAVGGEEREGEASLSCTSMANTCTASPTAAPSNMNRCSSASGLGLRRTSFLPDRSGIACASEMALEMALSSNRLGFFMGMLLLTILCSAFLHTSI